MNKSIKKFFGAASKYDKVFVGSKEFPTGHFFNPSPSAKNFPLEMVSQIGVDIILCECSQIIFFPSCTMRINVKCYPKKHFTQEHKACGTLCNLDEMERR